MPSQIGATKSTSALLIAIAVLLPNPLLALSLDVSALEFAAVELPAVETTEGAFDFIRPLALNNRGQVAGTALGPSDGNFVFDHKTAFLYDPHRGSEALDPYGLLFSSALFLNEKGQVLGDSCCDAKNRYRFFLASGGSDSNRLGKGWRGFIRNDFHPTALTDVGDIAGFCSKFEDPLRYQRLPVLNLRGHGWIDLSERDARLQQLTSVELEVLRLNRFGDFVMPTTHDGVLASFAGSALIQISPPEVENTVSELSDASEVVGEIHVPSEKYQLAGPERAYLFTPVEGLTEIHGGRFLNSRAVWITSTGTVGGYATKKREWQANDRLFTYRRSRGLTVTNLRRELHRLNPRLRFGSARPIDMNDKLQFIGEIQTRKKGEGGREPFNGKTIHFLIDPQAGLINLQRVLDKTWVDATIFSLVDLNDAGQVLVEGRRRSDQSRTAILLTPR